MPKIGYGSATKTRHVCPDGFKKFVIHNVKVNIRLKLTELDINHTANPQLKATFNLIINVLGETKRGEIQTAWFLFFLIWYVCLWHFKSKISQHILATKYLMHCGIFTSKFKFWNFISDRLINATSKRYMHR